VAGAAVLPTLTNAAEAAIPDRIVFADGVRHELAVTHLIIDSAPDHRRIGDQVRNLAGPPGGTLT
jgi:hypothetical protein